VLLYDSLGQPKTALTPEVEELIVALYGTTGRSLRYNNAACKKTTKKTDCKCFAIPWAVHLAYSDKPQTMMLDQKQLRSHLETCLLNPLPINMEW